MVRGVARVELLNLGLGNRLSFYSGGHRVQFVLPAGGWHSSNTLLFNNQVIKTAADLPAENRLRAFGRARRMTVPTISQARAARYIHRALKRAA